MRREIKIDTFIHKHNVDEIQEFEELEKLGILKDKDFPKPEQVLKHTTINIKHISFYQEVENGKTGIIMDSGLVLMTPESYHEVKHLIRMAYESNH